MNSISCKASWTKLTNCARSFILALFGLCSLFFGSAASASNLTNDVAQINVTVDLINDYLQQTLQASLSSWNQQIHSDLIGLDPTDDLSKIMAILSGRTLSQSQTWSETDNIRTYLQELTRFVAGSDAPQSTVVGSSSGLWKTQRDALSQLQKLNVSLRAVSNYLALASVSGTNIYNIKVDARDILAGNAWWASNSAFALTFNQYSRTYPSEYPNTGTTYSFPQFLSRWSAMMTLPGNGQGQIANSTLKRDWWRYFGSLSRTADAGDSYPYTWFDWMADAMRSNFVLQSSGNDLLSSISPSVSVTNLINLRADDVLAANPYWATNSQFAPVWGLWSNEAPRPQGTPATFPEAFSLLLSSRLHDYHPENGRDYYYDSWGFGGENTLGGNNWAVYSFDDWLADWLKSNLVLSTSSSVSNLNAELAATDYEEQQNPTNVPLPQFRDLIADGDTSAAEDEISGAASILTSKIEDLSGRIGTPNAEIVLFPAMTVGGITVRETRASLDSPITQTAHAVCVFIWYVALFASLFHLASAEFAFYANLGRNWVSSHGFIVDKESGDWV